MPLQPVRPGQLFGLLASVRDRCHLVAIRCGRQRLDGVCNRVLDKVIGDPSMGHLVSVMPMRLASGWIQPTPSGSTTTRSSITKRSVVVPDGGQRWTYECHERCRNPATGKRSTYTVRMDTLVVEYVRAVRAGADVIRLPLRSD